MKNLLKRLPFSFWLLSCLVLATCLWVSLFSRQLDRGCWINEWPFEKGCSDERPSGFLATKPLEVFPSYLVANPGNATVYSWLAINRVKSKALDSTNSIDVALQISPIDAQLLTIKANHSLTNQNWKESASALVKLVEIGRSEAHEPLLSLLSSQPQQSYVLSLINEKSVWLDGLLKNANPKFPISKLLPVFHHGRSLGIISAETMIAIVDRLQVAGRWLDAYSLWVVYNGTLKEGLFNTSFDLRVSQKAFDWKWSQSKDNQKGMLVRQISANPNSGLILEIELIGRSAVPLPMVSQVAMLFNENYIFRGNYRTEKLQIDEGLSWKFSCASGGEPWAQTEALQDTQKQWKKFELKLKVPAACGGAVLVGLETKNRGEARVGITGLAQFDDISLTSETRL